MHTYIYISIYPSVVLVGREADRDGGLSPGGANLDARLFPFMMSIFAPAVTIDEATPLSCDRFPV